MHSCCQALLDVSVKALVVHCQLAVLIMFREVVTVADAEAATRTQMQNAYVFPAASSRAGVCTSSTRQVAAAGHWPTSGQARRAQAISKSRTGKP